MSKKVKLASVVGNKIRTRRIFSDTFKRQRVKEIDANLISVTEVSKLYDVSKTSIYRWLDKYSPNHHKGVTQVVQMESEAEKTRVLLARIAELERTVGRKQMELDYLEKLLEISSKELNVDIKKNFDIESSPISTNPSDKRDLG